MAIGIGAGVTFVVVVVVVILALVMKKKALREEESVDLKDFVRNWTIKLLSVETSC